LGYLTLMRGQAKSFTLVETIHIVALNAHTARKFANGHKPFLPVFYNKKFIFLT